jgi:integrase
VKTLAVPVRDKDGQIVETVLRKDRSMMSMIRNHVVPSLGHLPLAALDPEQVGKAATTFHVQKTESTGKKTKRPASPGTQRRFLAALSSIWRHVFPFQPIPWKGVRIVEKVDAPADSDLVSGFDDESILLGDEDTGALTQEQLVRTLVAAEYLDQKNLRAKNNRNSFVPNTAYAIAMQAALGPRVSELVPVRWGHIFTKGYVILKNAKSRQVVVKKRAVPMQHSLKPWIEELRVREGKALDHNGYVIRTNPRGGPFAQAAITTLANRITAALELAGVKQPGKATHGLRATFASHADACPDIDGKMVQRYLGHHRVYGKSTDEYVRQMIGMIRESHRNIIQLPTPDEVRRIVKDFVPATRRPWKERKRPQSRTNAAKEERRQRGPRRPLGTSLDLVEDR